MDRVPRRLVSLIAVQTVTACRVFLAAGALVAAQYHRPHLCAAFITLGIVTDGVDGPVARRLKAETEFGGLFDYFADYLCYLVAPWTLSRLLVPEDEVATLLLLTVPLLAGAIRYSRNATRLRSESFEQSGFPGLLTVFYALFMVALVFLGLEEAIDLKWPVLATVTCFSVLMVSPIRYPKLTRFRSIFLVVYISLCVMPFALTRFLAWSTLFAVFAYAILSPWLTLLEKRLSSNRDAQAATDAADR